MEGQAQAIFMEGRDWDIFMERQKQTIVVVVGGGGGGKLIYPSSGVMTYYSIFVYSFFKREWK